jgi:glycosyltransferase involved in cell wall biosynthesis
VDASRPHALEESLQQGEPHRVRGARALQSQNDHAYARLRPLYAGADALLLPTRYDAFANVCLEAAAAGLPVVTSGANGAAEIACDAGIVVDDPEDVAGFARALDRLAEPSARSALGKAARAIAERHGWDAHAIALRALYARLLA